MRYPLACVLSKWLFLLVALPSVAFAQVSLVFERTEIRIDPVILQSSQPGEPVEVRASTIYSIELRGQDALRFDSIQSLNSLGESNGVMIVFNAPSLAPLPPYRDETPLDVLLLSEEGIILHALSDISLAQAPVVANTTPVKAFLFLKAGQIKARNLRANDIVTGSMFIRNAVR